MKKVIDGLLLALGVVLVLTGAWWMWVGWDIVQAERGWVAAISGSVMMTGGFILIGLVWAIVRLQPVVPEVAAAPLARAKPDLHSEPEFPARLEVPPAPAPVEAPSAPAPAIVAGAAAAFTTIGAVSAFGRAGHDADDRERVEGQSERSEDAAQAQEPELEPPPPRRPSIGDLMRRIVPSSAPPTDPEPARPAAEEAPASADHDEIVRNEDMIDDEWADEPHHATEDHPPLPPAGPIFPGHTESEKAEPSEPEAAAAEPKASDDEGDWFDQAERSLDRALGRPPHEPDASGAAETEPEAPKKPPAITGRYSSGDTNYIMFDDGSIEAQTPDGVMRFASLVELRRFVEQRQ